MSYQIDIQPSGLFVLKNAGGKPLFDGAFRTDIPTHMRVAELNLIAEAPEMFHMLQSILANAEASTAELIEKNGGGAVGQKLAMEAAPALFDMREALRAQIARASGELVEA